MTSKILRQIIVPKDGVAPLGPYSAAVRAGSTLYISGQLGIDPATGDFVPGGIAEQTRKAMMNMENVLAGAGIGFNNLVKTTILLADMNDFVAMNDVYKTFLIPGKFPARACYQVACLPKNARVEIEAVAVMGDIADD